MANTLRTRRASLPRERGGERALTQRASAPLGL